MAKFLIAIACFVAITTLQTNALAIDKGDATRCADKSESLCTTPECIHSASALLKNMNPSIDPCDSFYDFACGNFGKQHVIPDDKSSVSGFSIIGDSLLGQMKHMLEEPIKDDDILPFVMAKKLYNLCYDLKTIDENGVKPIESVLRRLGGWPVIEGSKWNKENFNWKSTVYNLQDAGFNAYSLLPITVTQNSKNSSQNIIQMLQGLFQVDRASSLQGFENALVAAYYEYAVDIAVLLGANKETALTELKEVIEFEIEVAKITIPSEEQRDASSKINQMTIRELQDRFVGIPWLEFISNALKPGEIEITLDDVIDVSYPTYVTNLIPLLERTSERVLHNHLIMHVVMDAIPYLSKTFKRAMLKYQEASTGSKTMEPRSTVCVNMVNQQLTIATSALYVRNYFDDASKKTTEQLVKDLRDTFTDVLKDIDWMDEDTKAKALEKEVAIRSHIAYPQQLLDDKIIEEYYAKLNFTSDSYLESFLITVSFSQHNLMKKLRNPDDKNDWTLNAEVVQVNAYYAPKSNAIILPAGILQGVFFNNQRPHYMNYGSMGFVIGHEITHGFDDEGRQYDKNGEVSEWWGEETKKLFVERAQCFIDQYGNFTSPAVNLNVNGINTQGENIADAGGIKKAYLAYEKWIERNAEEHSLPGLNYTPRQLFWISSANVWCSKDRKEFLKLQILTDNHSPNNFRVDGTFQNSDYFAKDFNCPSGSRMNPVKKCQIW